jgi:hypothetical protein
LASLQKTSNKQRIGAFWNRFRASRRHAPRTFDKGHDVGSEYALYMVGPLEKIAVFAPAAAPRRP